MKPMTEIASGEPRLRNLPFSKKWQSHSGQAQVVIIYTESDEAWNRAKREVAKGWPILLLPNSLEPAQARFPVLRREVFIIDLFGVSFARAKEIGSTVLQFGATGVVYFGPANRTIFFQPEVVSWVA